MYGKTNAGSSKSGMVKLWENASPTSVFAAQTVPIDLSEYDCFDIDFRAYPKLSSGKNATVRVRKNEASTAWCVVGGQGDQTGVPSFITRMINATDSGISFGECYSAEVTSNFKVPSTPGAFLIPLRIYGIKGVS